MLSKILIFPNIMVIYQYYNKRVQSFSLDLTVE